jgi:GTP-binding protein HflX
LHVVDASSPSAEQQIATVNSVLKEIGIDASRAVLVLNKIDALRDRSYLDVLRANHEPAVSVSAVERTGLDQLGRIVAERLGDGYVDATLETNVGNGRLLSYLAAHAEVVSQDYVDSRVTLQCRIPRRFLNTLPADDAQVHLANGNGSLLVRDSK